MGSIFDRIAQAETSWAVCQTDVVPYLHRQIPGAPAGGGLSGRWHYDRTAGRGIALSYDRNPGRAQGGRLADVHAGGRFAGRWRYNRFTGRGIALSYGGSAGGPPPEPPVQPSSPPATRSPAVRVLCYCGTLFAFDGEQGICPGCGQPAEWPTMGEIEREMRSDLDELLSAYEQGADPD
jgi:hypothetical protein